MNELIFGISFIILLAVFIKRHDIVNFLSYNLNITIESKTLTYILSFFFVILIIVGMLFADTKEKYSGISENYDNLRPNPKNQRPHRYFDVNTYN